MSAKLEGALHDDQVHRIFRTLFDEELLEALRLWPFFTVTQDIDAPRYFKLVKNVVATDIEIEPPEGRVWEILHAHCVFVADDGVADRVVSLTTRATSDNATISAIYSITKTAEQVAMLEVGYSDPSGGQAVPEHCDVKVILTHELKLVFAATNKEDGDTLSVRGLIKETINYAP